MASVLAGVLAAPLACAVARFLASRWSRVDSRVLSAATLAGLAVLIGLATGLLGLAVAGLSCVVGLVPVRVGARRVHLMASLLVPVLAGYLLR